MELGLLTIESTKNIDKELKESIELLNGSAKYGLRYISFNCNFPKSDCEELEKLNLTPVLTWELLFHDEDKFKKGYTYIDEVLNGRLDHYFEKFIRDIKNWGKTIYLRPLHEFNTDWYSWGGKQNGGPNGGPEKIKKAWIYIVDKFKKADVKNVKWIWCPHETSMGASKEDWNRLINYWPGEEYVDLLGLDGFNFYPKNPEREAPFFQSFDDLFQDIYKEITEISNKPIFIMTGSSEFTCQGEIGSKREWLEDAFNKISNKYNKIEIFGWFNLNYGDGVDWRVNSSKDSLEVFNKTF